MKILLVEDNPADVHIFRELLKETRLPNQVDMIHVNRISKGLEWLTHGSVDLIMLDLILPDATGLEGLELLYQNGLDLPVVVLTGMRDVTLGLKAVQVGAQDYLIKDEVTGPLLDRCMRYAIERHQLLKQIKDEAESEIELERNRLRAVLEATPLPIISVDIAGIVTDWNKAAERLFGWSKDEILGNRCPIVPETERSELGALIDRTTDRDDINGRLFPTRHRDGSTINTHLFTAGLVDASGGVTGAILALQDVTERTRFLQVASHELNNPLSTIKAIASLLMHQVRSGKSLNGVSERLSVLQQQVDRTAELMNTIVQALRVQEGYLDVRLEPCDLSASLESIVASYSLSTKTHRFSFSCHGERVVPVLADHRRLQQVFHNLLNNAMKYSREGTVVHVDVSRTRKYGLVTVRDEGQGIPENELQRVFESFYRGSNLDTSVSGGMGLGLFVCKDIVERHHGRIWATSDEVGSAFYVKLPLFESS